MKVILSIALVIALCGSLWALVRFTALLNAHLSGWLDWPDAIATAALVGFWAGWLYLAAMATIFLTEVWA